jgi:heat-inducible transcriptional repressor
VTELGERGETLLKALIELYITDGQPVGSRTLAKRTDLSLSPATVRNVMSDLEDLGLINSPHTSAGRVPTQLGYRMFVDSLLTVKPLNEEAIASIQSGFSSEPDPQLLLSIASEMLSKVTHFAGLILIPGQENARFRQIEFLKLSSNRVLAILVTDDGRVQNRVIPTDREYSGSELTEAANYFNDAYNGSSLAQVRRMLLGEMKTDSDRMHEIMKTAVAMASKLFDQEEGEKDDVVLTGEENLLNIPDLCQIDTLQKLFDAFKTKQDLLDLLDRGMRVNGISIFIGEESGYLALNDVSVVTAPYQNDGSVVGTLGVIGPTRMDYEQVIPVVDFTARLLSGALSGKQIEQTDQ